jgi:hypothetical protein
MASGWDVVVPLTILKFIQNIPRQIISSHLQKIKKEMRKVYGEISNVDQPIHISSGRFNIIAKHWQKNQKPMTDEQIWALLNDK